MHIGAKVFFHKEGGGELNGSPMRQDRICVSDPYNLSSIES